MATTNGFINTEGKSDLFITVKCLMECIQKLTKDPSNVSVYIPRIASNVAHLKHLLDKEKHESSASYALAIHHQSRSERRKNIEILHNLIQYLEIQLDKVEDSLGAKQQHHGLHYYVASISNVVLGISDVARICRMMELRLGSWLDQQGVRELVQLIVGKHKSSSDEHIALAISSFEHRIRKGFDASLQDTILSSGLVDKLVALLEPRVATTSWKVQKKSALALITLLDFNKDVFISMIVMSKLVENLFSLLDNAHTRPEKDLLLELLLIFKSLLSTGEGFLVDAIYSKNGIPRIIGLLDHKTPALQHVAMECVMELAYHGTVEVVKKMLELEVIKKLANLQKTNTHVICAQNSHMEMLAQLERDPSLYSHDNHSLNYYPFVDAVMKFTLHFASGTGLRQRERHALKQEVIKQIKDIVDDDVQSANITTEILWAF